MSDPIVIAFAALTLVGFGCLLFVAVAATLIHLFPGPLAYIERALVRPWWD